MGMVPNKRKEPKGDSETASENACMLQMSFRSLSKELTSSQDKKESVIWRMPSYCLCHLVALNLVEILQTPLFVQGCFS